MDEITLLYGVGIRKQNDKIVLSSNFVDPLPQHHPCNNDVRFEIILVQNEEFRQVKMALINKLTRYPQRSD